jgi:hypothetical protein
VRSICKPLIIVLAVAVAVGLGGTARADDMGAAETITVNPAGLSTSELDARIAFIEQRLDASQKHAWYWQNGWLGFYGAGAIVQSARAGASHDDEHQADYIVSAIKAAGGVARMYFMPHPVTHGADPIRAMGGNTREAKARKLAKAEELLLESARFSDRRFSTKAHVANALVNVAGGAIIWGLGSPSTALESTLVGIAVGTANILSAPWRGDDDLRDYKAQFSGTARGWDWKLVPTLSGAAVQVTF